MNPEIKAKWLEALRSGRYVQGLYTLRTIEDKFCCLGVLCDISSVLWQPRGESNYLAIYGSDARTGDIPAPLLEKFGLIGKTDKLIKLNDAGRSFSEIADWIEANL